MPSSRYRIRGLSFLLLFIAALVSRPALAQNELSGQWNQKMFEDRPERGPGPWIGDYTGMPITDQDRMRGDTWDAEKWAVVERQCQPHPADYAPRGPAALRVWTDIDPLTQGVKAWNITTAWMLPHRTIYMDGRPHPPAWAAHTWQGFSTGEWEADALKITTTHLKEGWVRRNGLARSDRATLIEYLVRHHRYLTLVTMVEDPIYLTEPLVRTSDWVEAENNLILPNLCVEGVEVEHEKGWVPYHLPGQNQFLYEWADKVGMPHEATRGGAETMYPEYQKKLATMAVSKTQMSSAKGAQ
ncbi:MAG: hypothetical protein ABSA96_02480 [Candidatus Acidiferrales bacterium]|jgi:hypothetical protein